MMDPLQQKYGSRIGSILLLPSIAGDIIWLGAVLSALGSIPVPMHRPFLQLGKTFINQCVGLKEKIIEIEALPTLTTSYAESV